MRGNILFFQAHHTFVEVNNRPFAAVQAVAGAAIAAGIIAYYRGRYFEAVQMTFMSNLLCGIVLCVGGVMRLAGKRAPKFLYLDCAVLMADVIAVCAIFDAREAFAMPSAIFHLITPLCVIALGVLAAGKVSANDIPSVLVFPSLYYLFMTVYSRAASPVYACFDPASMSAATLLGAFFLATAMTIAFAFMFRAVSAIVYSRTAARVGASRESGS